MTPIPITAKDVALPDPGSPTFTAECDALASELIVDAHGPEDHWNEMARRLLSAAIAHAAKHERPNIDGKVIPD
jgi:hypothetical protein